MKTTIYPLLKVNELNTLLTMLVEQERVSQQHTENNKLFFNDNDNLQTMPVFAGNN